MKTGPFIQHVAKTTSVAEATVKVIARFLREAGYLTTTTGARGLNGPDMVPRDAARLILTLAVTTSPAEAVAAYERASKMIFSIGNSPEAVEKLTALGFPCNEGQTVEDAVTALMEPDAPVDRDLMLTLVSKAGNPIRFECRRRVGKEDVEVHFRPDISHMRDEIEALRSKTPQEFAEWAEPSLEEELAAFKRYGEKALLSPDGFMDKRTIGAGSLLWLRWKAFEGGEE